ncbi:MAG: dTDP-4-dehydrorhamnose reductase [Treponema sp.]|nr:dTDP-4-dehydrorhamnose reductase [Treponema sp.]
MHFFVTGVAGQLGHDVVNELLKRGHTAVASDIHSSIENTFDNPASEKCSYVSLDITCASAVEKAVLQHKPDVIIHCAAWTAVDAAEDEENRSKVHAINAEGTENLSEVAAKTGCKFIYISTDYIFNGQGTEPWKPDCKDYEPLNVYGQSKLEGELSVTKNLEKYFIVRIAWVFGKNGKNFIKTIVNAAKKQIDEKGSASLRVVSDQIGTPTYTFDLARLLVDMAETEKYGIYHATNEGGFISWYDFTKEIIFQAEELGLIEKNKTTVDAVTTEEYGLSKAKRPFNSRLDKSKLSEKGFELLPHWKDALTRYLKEM